MFWDIVFWLGAYQMLWWLYRWACLLYRTYFGTIADTKRYGYDSWAVVTGCTDGIGKA